MITSVLLAYDPNTLVSLSNSGCVGLFASPVF